MASNMLKTSIKTLLKKHQFLTQSDIAKNIKTIDKVRLSGFLKAMVEYGDIDVKQAGNSKVYYLKDIKRLLIRF